MSIKFVCDICGAETSEKKFLIPMQIIYIATGGKNKTVLTTFSTIEAQEINLCPQCQSFIANFISSIKR